MDIRIGDFRITSDDRNIILREVKKTVAGDKIGTEYDEIIGYYGKLEDVFNALLDLKVRRSPCRTLKQLLIHIKMTRSELSFLLDGV